MYPIDKHETYMLLINRRFLAAANLNGRSAEVRVSIGIPRPCPSKLVMFTKHHNGHCKTSSRWRALKPHRASSLWQVIRTSCVEREVDCEVGFGLYEGF